MADIFWPFYFLFGIRMIAQGKHKSETEELRYWPGTNQLTKNSREVAKILNVHYNTIGRWVKLGDLECIRFGETSVHFTYDQVEYYINNNRSKVSLNMEK